MDKFITYLIKMVDIKYLKVLKHYKIQTPNGAGGITCPLCRTITWLYDDEDDLNIISIDKHNKIVKNTNEYDDYDLYYICKKCHTFFTHGCTYANNGCTDDTSWPCLIVSFTDLVNDIKYVGSPFIESEEIKEFLFSDRFKLEIKCICDCTFESPCSTDPNALYPKSKYLKTYHPVDCDGCVCYKKLGREHNLEITKQNINLIFKFHSREGFTDDFMRMLDKYY